MPPIDGSVGPVQYICSHPECDKSFNKIKYLRRHQKVHDRGTKPSFICCHDDCLKLFWTQKDLDRHVNTPHGSPVKRILACQHCGKEFKHKFDLKIHDATHTGEKPLVCDKCGARFALKSRLKQHLKTHKSYNCSLDNCSFTCDKWTQLRKHVSENHKKQCPGCTKKFTSAESLENHVATHSLVMKCPHCDLTYSRKSNLTTHVRAVHQKLIYKCSFEGCNKELQHRKSLRDHMKIHKSNQEVTTKPPKTLVTKRNIVMAELLTGVTADDQEKQELLIKDKKFRSEYNKFQQEVRIY